MIEDNAIIDTPLPAAQNFHFLKAEGIDIIQQLVGELWTNFNDSDPGVTILDQLCYALTELGYCNEFDIADILTGADGKITYNNQFFLPQDILTSSAITVTDMRKMLLDAMPALANVYIDPLKANDPRLERIGLNGLLGVYQVYLFVDESYVQGQVSTSAQAPISGFRNKDLQQDLSLPQQAYELLNRQRNIGEWYLSVVALENKTISLEGSITLALGANKVEVRSLIQQALSDYVSPAICRYGYQQMVDLGYGADEIFNGPRMDNGWIIDEDLAAPKRHYVKINEIKAIVDAIDGVSSVEYLSITGSNGVATDLVTVRAKEIAVIDSSRLAISGQSQQGFDLTQQLNDELSQLGQIQMQSVVDASVDIAPTPPQGNYRDIESYYAVQNTFPEEYGIGFEGLPASSSDFRHAQAKQLKGYLTIFDQILANQFSQLAHVADWFSFVGISTIAQGTATQFTPETKPYAGIPYQIFPPTYFCQDVYNIPDIQPLLLGNQMYRFGPDPITTLAQEQKIWLEYQQNPFNQYMYGLRQGMETDDERDDRRGRMLDHLLARHGVDAKQIDTVLTQARWYGSTAKTRIIIKSILLQNYQGLSYNRSKAYSTLFANPIGTPGRYRLTTEGFKYLSDYGISPLWLSSFVDYGWHDPNAIIEVIKKRPKIASIIKTWSEDKVAQFVKQCLVIEDGYERASILNNSLYRDGQLDMEKLSAAEQLTDSDFNDYAGVSLTINLLLGLSQYYQTIVSVLITLLQSDSFSTWLKQNQNSPHTLNVFELKDSFINIKVRRQYIRDGFSDTVIFNDEALVNISNVRQPNLNGEQVYGKYIDQLQWLAYNAKGMLLLEPITWLAGINTKAKMADMPYTSAHYQLLTLSVIPAYVVQLNDSTSALHIHLEKLIAALWPAHVQNYLLALDYDTLADVITPYVRWHNILRRNSVPNDEQLKHAQSLAEILLPIIYGPETSDLAKLSKSNDDAGGVDADIVQSNKGGTDDS